MLNGCLGLIQTTRSDDRPADRATGTTLETGSSGNLVQGFVGDGGAVHHTILIREHLIDRCALAVLVEHHLVKGRATILGLGCLPLEES